MTCILKACMVLTILFYNGAKAGSMKIEGSWSITLEWPQRNDEHVIILEWKFS